MEYSVSHPSPHYTTVSTQGQLTIANAIPQRRNGDDGTQLNSDDTAEGVLIRQTPSVAQTRPEDVFGCLRRNGSRIEIDAKMYCAQQREP